MKKKFIKSGGKSVHAWAEIERQEQGNIINALTGFSDKATIGSWCAHLLLKSQKNKKRKYGLTLVFTNFTVKFDFKDGVKTRAIDQAMRVIRFVHDMDMSQPDFSQVDISNQRQVLEAIKKSK